MYDYVVLDIEATKIPNFKPWQPNAYLCSVCIELPDKQSHVWFFNPLVGTEEKNISEIQKVFDLTKCIVGHNIKYDLLWLIHLGFKMDHLSVFDTMVAEYLLKAQNPKVELNLNAVAERYKLGQKVDEMKKWWDDGFETDQIPLDLHERYVKQDVALTHQVYSIQSTLLERNGLNKVAAVTFGMTKILAEVEYRGAPFVLDRARTYCDEARANAEALNAKLIEIAGIEFNPASSDHLRAILYGGEWKEDGIEEYEVTLKSGIVKKKTRKCKVPVKYKGLGFKCDSKNISKKTGKPSTDAQALGALHPNNKVQRAFLDTLETQRKLLKTVSTIEGSKGDKGWISCLTGDGRLHGQFNQTVTVTGRLSSSQPNL